MNEVFQAGKRACTKAHQREWEARQRLVVTRLQKVFRLYLKGNQGAIEVF